MTWFRMESSFADHPKTIDLADLLRISKAQAAGHMALLWCKVAECKPDGVLDRCRPRTIALWADWVGDADFFVRALVQIGFADRREDGELELHEWMERAEGFKEAKRKAEWRSRKPSSVQRDLPLTGQSRDSPGTLTSTRARGRTDGPTDKTDREDGPTRPTEPVTIPVEQTVSVEAESEFVRSEWNQHASAESGLLPEPRLTEEAKLALDRTLFRPGRDRAWVRKYIERVAASPWCRGEIYQPNCRRWNIAHAFNDEGTIHKVEAGTYDPRASRAPPHLAVIQRRPSRDEELMQIALEAQREEAFAK